MVEAADRLAVEALDQQPLGFLLLHMGARIDMAVADPVLERDAPLPAGGAGGGAGEGEQGLGPLGRDGDGAVAGQPVAPIVELDTHRLAEEEGAEARAVDEQLALHPPVVVEPHRADVSGLRIALDVDDPPLDPLDPARFGVAAEELAVEAGVEMEGVREVGEGGADVGRGVGEAAVEAGDWGDGVGDQRADAGMLAVFAPEVVEIDAVIGSPDPPERVEIALSL